MIEFIIGLGIGGVGSLLLGPLVGIFLSVYALRGDISLMFVLGIDCGSILSVIISGLSETIRDIDYGLGGDDEDIDIRDVGGSYLLGKIEGIVYGIILFLVWGEIAFKGAGGPILYGLFVFGLWGFVILCLNAYELDWERGVLDLVLGIGLAKVLMGVLGNWNTFSGGNNWLLDIRDPILGLILGYLVLPSLIFKLFGYKKKIEPIKNPELGPYIGLISALFYGVPSSAINTFFSGGYLNNYRTKGINEGLGLYMALMGLGQRSMLANYISGIELRGEYTKIAALLFFSIITSTLLCTFFTNWIVNYGGSNITLEISPLLYIIPSILGLIYGLGIIYGTGIFLMSLFIGPRHKVTMLVPLSVLPFM